MSDKRIIFFFLLPVFLSFILHFYVFKLDLSGYHVWRQTQTQTVIYNFSFSDNSIFHPQKFDLSNGTTALLYEFPLYQWLIAQVNNVWGYSVMHSRALTFVFFVLLLAGFYKLIRYFFSTEISLIANTLICFSPMLYYYCVTPLPDILALCCAVWALYFFFRFLSSGKTLSFIFFSFFIMCSALIKLPYILFGGVFAWYCYNGIRKKEFSGLVSKLLVFCLSLIPVCAWYLRVIPTWGNNPVTKGIINNNKTVLYLLDCFQFNVLSTVPEVIANYASCLFLLTGMYLFYKHRKRLSETQKYFVVLFILFSAYFVFELNAIEKVHDYYLMPFIPLVFLVITYGLRFFYEKKSRILISVMVCLVPLMAWLRMDHRWDEVKPGPIQDYQNYGEAIRKLIPENSICIVDHDESRFISLYYLKRKGYSLFENKINPGLLGNLYSKGATYLVTENRSFVPDIYKDFSFTEVFSKNIRIFKLDHK